MELPPENERYSYIGKTGSPVVLGKGSYGIVRPAWDRQQNCLVAIKAQMVDSETARREMMFFQCMPRHPNVLQFLDVYVERSRVLLVFEYLCNRKCF